jgi:threonine/homoserine/homoserine lactone efflux protein
MLEFLVSGVVLGLSAGLSPGPLLALLISETLRHGALAGVRVALAPLLTDLPIVAGALLLVSQISGADTLFGLISLLGGCFVVYLGIENLRSRGLDVSKEQPKPHSLLRGVTTNALNPHPYLFWVSVGAPTTVRAWSGQDGGLAAGLFLGGFYALLVGSKAGLALVAGRSRNVLRGRAYLTTMRALGLALCGFALLLFRDGARLLGWLGQ